MLSRKGSLLNFLQAILDLPMHFSYRNSMAKRFNARGAFYIEKGSKVKRLLLTVL